MNSKKSAPQAAETPAGKYGRWARIAVSILTFGMVFPNALIEGMARTELPPYVANDEGKKGN